MNKILKDKDRLLIPNEIKDVERKMWCQLYKLLCEFLPGLGIPVQIDMMFYFLNTDSGLVDAFRLDNIMLAGEDGHAIKLCYSTIDYEATSRSADAIDVTDDCFLPNETCILQCNTGDITNMLLLMQLVDNVQRKLAARLLLVEDPKASREEDGGFSKKIALCPEVSALADITVDGHQDLHEWMLRTQKENPSVTYLRTLILE